LKEEFEDGKEKKSLSSCATLYDHVGGSGAAALLQGSLRGKGKGRSGIVRPRNLGAITQRHLGGTRKIGGLTIVELVGKPTMGRDTAIEAAYDIWRINRRVRGGMKEINKIIGTPGFNGEQPRKDWAISK